MSAFAVWDDRTSGTVARRSQNANSRDHSFLFTSAHPKDFFNSSEITNRSLKEESTGLSEAFFSATNVQRIQRLLIATVLRKTSGLVEIGEQSERDLRLAMQDVYDEHARNLKCEVGKQISELNSILVRSSVRHILINVKQYLAYRRDIENPIKPHERPINVSSRGRRTLPSTTSAWGF
jgi:hypothetical protein